MRCIHSLITVVVLFGLAASAQAQLQSTSPLAPPEVRAWSKPLEKNASDATIVRITVDIPADHHGYLDSGDEGLLIPLAFTFDDPGIEAQEISRPQGTRDEQAHATVLRGQGEFAFQLAVSGSVPDTPHAKLRYQICNDITNICYPPQTVQVPLQLAAAQNLVDSKTDAAPGEPAPASFRERLAVLFRQSTNNLFFAITLVFVAGLIASATPCVYPILPITSAILMARGSRAKQSAHMHALTYFAGLVFFYALLGVFAVTTGTALSAVMTNPWVNLGFAVLFVYLGLSMLGLYEFQFMTALTAKLDSASSQRSGLSGTFFMGTTAGLVVSPCVGPVVGAILLDITGQAAAVSTANTALPSDIVVRGIALMTSFGAGLGVPFLVVGLLSNRLPQSGAWLTKVKFLLGLPILYFAYIYYIKSLETLGVPSNIAHAILVGIVSIVLAVFVGAFHATGGMPSRQLQLRLACGMILLVIGIHFLYNGLGSSGILIDQSSSAQMTAATSSPADDDVETHGNLRWWRNITTARQLAHTESKPLFVDFYATWCANCKAFNRLAITHEELNQALQQVILIKIYDTDPDFKTFQQDQRLPELRGVGGQPFLPLFAIYSSQGELLWKGQDYQAANTMIAQLERAKHVTVQ
jgi:thiol:disulfide interchange protein DsbD